MTARRKNILVGVYANKNETMVRDIFPVLQYFGFKFKSLDRNDLKNLTRNDADVLLLPGGWYFFKDEKIIRKKICSFVRENGGYVGICCGAINACQLGLINADLINMGGLGPVQVRVVPAKKKHPVLKGVVHKGSITMLRYNGWPMLIRKDAHMIASYDSDMKVAAIVYGKYGLGRVVAFSPHPEGCACGPGDFRDRDNLSLVYDGIKMGTARMLANAVNFCANSI